MFSFIAYTFEGQACFKEGSKTYEFGEILTYYMNLDMEKPKRFYDKLKKIRPYCLYPVSEEHEMIKIYNESVLKAQGLMSNILLYAKTLQPYKVLKSQHLEETPEELTNLLNQYQFLFDSDEFDTSTYRKKNENEDNMFDVGELGYLNVETHESELIAFIPDLGYIEHVEDGLLEATKLNEQINKLFDCYLGFLADVLRIEYVYAPFLDNIVHASDTKMLANRMKKYFEQQSKGALEPRAMNDARNIRISYDVIETKEKNSTFSRQTYYPSVGAFLYLELMEGVETERLPKRCKNCKRYFLHSTSYSNEYCENIAPGETERTCKEVGAKKSFEEKVKSDPVWLEHQRAYKTHYARMTKKKMTKEEFLNWGDMAADLRDKALAGEIPFEEYVEKIKK
ncbi:DUF6076 domain-containing protein [Christensenellaceae bacterium OttesenSCG-928-K19]|nr:DUF6076 domain-containing protein [Christensenellaceae bacterium OttesenSCG-928-K19]